MAASNVLSFPGDRRKEVHSPGYGTAHTVHLMVNGGLGDDLDGSAMDSLWIGFAGTRRIRGSSPGSHGMTAETVTYLPKCGISEQIFRGDAKEMHD